MATIPVIHCEQIQAGLAAAPSTAVFDVWPSLDPTIPMGFQITSPLAANINGVTNQNGIHNGIGAHIITGLAHLLGIKTGLGGQVNAEPAATHAALNISWQSASVITATSFNVNGALTQNGVPVQLTSDRKFKTNIKHLENSLEKVTQLNGVEYDRIDFKTHEVGLIAQEVESVVPDLVRVDNKGTKLVEYKNLTALLVEAIKEQQKQITELKGTVQELSTKLAECCP